MRHMGQRRMLLASYRNLLTNILTSDSLTKMTLDHVSASQVKLFKSCPRKWFNQYVLRLEVPSSPALEAGKAFHSAVESYLKSGVIPEGPWAEHIKLASPYLPNLESKYFVEQKIVLPTYQDGPD